jgi:hypothetical protein
MRFRGFSMTLNLEDERILWLYTVLRTDGTEIFSNCRQVRVRNTCQLCVIGRATENKRRHGGRAEGERS